MEWLFKIIRDIRERNYPSPYFTSFLVLDKLDSLSSSCIATLHIYVHAI